MGVLFLLVLVIALGATLALVFSELQQHKELLRRFEPIRNIEKHQAKLEAEIKELRESKSAITDQIKEKLDRLDELTEKVGAVERGVDLRDQLQRMLESLRLEVALGEEKLANLQRTLGPLEQGINLQAQLQKMLDEQKRETERREDRLLALATRLGGLERAVLLIDELKESESKLELLKREIDSLEINRDVFPAAIRRRQFALATTADYRARLENLEARQRGLAKVGNAIRTPDSGEAGPKGKKLPPQARLFLRAFNSECDALVERVKHGNIDSLQDRLVRSFEEINALGETEGLCVTNEYLMLKLEELNLAHELQARLHAEREEQKALNEQARDEERAQREIERAKEEAEQEVAVRNEALERARRELAAAAAASAGEREEMQKRIAALQQEVKEANERKERAIAQAQLTKTGHVYIISNIGSFGENCFKIGMTRRLDPRERIDELGSASVPFPFDVHAMIRTEDAPALEAALHRHFEAKRVNKVNTRKEFFYVSLEEIRAAAREVHMGTIDFVETPAADAYRRSLALEGTVVTETQTEAPLPLGSP